MSGLARGIDGIAHGATIEAGGKTIAVLGTGIDISYPREHRALQEHIAQEGLVLSEFAPGTPGLRHHFPGRNRIIAVLARGVVVVEAPYGSGALHTADHALDVGVEVFAVPGPIGRPESMGTNGLMRVGAHIVTCAEDVLEELHIPLPPPAVAAPAVPPTSIEGRVLAALAEEPVLADDLAIQIGLSPADTLALLLELEVAGAVRRLPGLRFAPVPNVATVGSTMG
jgi:DNA processing protein